MDPFAIIGAVQSTISFVHEIQKSYHNAHRTLTSISNQCRIFATGLEHIRTWITTRTPESALKEDMLRNLWDALAVIQDAVDRLNNELNKVLARTGGSMMGMGDTVAGRWMKARIVMNEEKLKEHLVELRECSALLQLTISVSQMHTPEETGRHLQEVTVGASEIRRRHTTRQRLRIEHNRPDSSVEFQGFLESLDAAEQEAYGQGPNTQLSHLLLDDVPSNPVGYPSPSQPPIVTTEYGVIDNATLQQIDSVHTTSHEPGELMWNPQDSDGIIPLQPPEARHDQPPQISRCESEPTIPSRHASSVFSTSTMMTTDTSATEVPDYSFTPYKEPNLPNSPPFSPSPSMSSSVRRKPLISRASTGFSPSSHGSTSPSYSSTSQSESNSTALTSLVRANTDFFQAPAFLDSSSSVAGYFSRARQPTWDSRNALVSPGIGKTSPTSYGPVEPSPTSTEYDINRPDAEGFPMIVRAAREGQEDVVYQLLSDNANVEAAHVRSQSTALHEASKMGHESIITMLVRRGSSLDRVDSNGMSALHHSVSSGSLGVAKVLSSNGASIDVKGPDNKTPLHFAAETSNEDLVALLIEKTANQNALDASNKTPLHLSAARGNEKICNILLDHGAQADLRDACSKTAIQLAAEAGKLEVVELLLHRSNLKVTDHGSLLAFYTAVESGQVRTAESFLDQGLSLKNLKGDSYKPATLAAKSGSIAMLDLMISRKCRLKDKDPNEWSALHHACHNGSTSVAQRLLEKDLSGKATTARKETPLLLAVKAGHLAIVETLLRNKAAALGTKDSEGQEPHHHAIRSGRADIVNLLLSNKASVTSENNYGWKPIHIACAYGHLGIVQELISRGASLEEKLNDTDFKKEHTHYAVENGYWAEARSPYVSSRPLHLAIEFGHNDIARFLISSGAKIEATCSEGWRPLHHASFSANPETVQLLIGMNAHVHAKTNADETALTLLYHRSREEVSELDRQRVQKLLGDAMSMKQKQVMDGLRGVLKFKAKTGRDKEGALKAVKLASSVLGDKAKSW